VIPAKLLVEFIGTFILTLTTGLTGLTGVYTVWLVQRPCHQIARFRVWVGVVYRFESKYFRFPSDQATDAVDESEVLSRILVLRSRSSCVGRKSSM
jgi:hypothetical protein